MERYRKYLPPELALAQLATEGGLNDRKDSRPIKTNNPFNVGNVDSGNNRFFSSVQEGVNQYYMTMAKEYLVKGKTATDLARNFVNKSGNRYASSLNYESMINQIALEAHNIASPILASLGKQNNSQNFA
jgi:hypothetical protein